MRNEEKLASSFSYADQDNPAMFKSSCNLSALEISAIEQIYPCATFVEEESTFSNGAHGNARHFSEQLARIYAVGAAYLKKFDNIHPAFAAFNLGYKRLSASESLRCFDLSQARFLAGFPQNLDETVMSSRKNRLRKSVGRHTCILGKL